MTPLLSVMLFVELGETTPRQRTIFRRELLQSGWLPVEVLGHVFASQMSDVKSDQEMLDRTTRHVHDAVRSADISDWTADCICSDVPTLAMATTGSEPAS